MLALGPIGFTAPWLLLGLAALPVLWLLLRAVPPAPIRRRFPGVALLLGLTDDDTESDRTPWWLLLLRTLAVAAVILGFAGPVLNPQPRPAGSGPLLVLVDSTWAAARDWPRRMSRVQALLTEAGRAGRPVTVVATTDLPVGGAEFGTADDWLQRLPSLHPEAWRAGEDLVNWVDGLDGSFETFWLSDGLGDLQREKVLAALEQRGGVSVFESPTPIYGLLPATYENGTILLTALRAAAGPAVEERIVARGPDPSGFERELAQLELVFPAGERRAELPISLPPELRNRITRFEFTASRSAGSVSLTDDALKRREIALVAGNEDREGLELLSQLHYLRRALEPTADLIDGTIDDILLANPDVIVLADVARLTDHETENLLDWLDDGGLLLRFAGPRLAASDVSRDTEDPLMPVRLRAGGRTVGGAMSWGEPKALMAFDAESPFHGLTIPPDVAVNAQVLAQPDLDLADRVIASLADGTPLVTRKGVGRGRVVLFHVTANAEWSTLPLSGLFVRMLERLAVSTRPDRPTAADLEGTVWQADEILDGYGQLADAGNMPGIPGERLVEQDPGPDLPPGLYAGADRRMALNVLGPDAEIAAAIWPDRIPVEGLSVPRETQLKGSLLSIALAFLALDLIASLWISGKLGIRRGGAVAAIALAVLLPRQSAQAQETTDDIAIAATSVVTLAHVITGNPEVDDMTHAGLLGLSEILYARTTVEPAEPTEVDLETDELSFFPFLYWPVTEDQPLPSSEAYARLNRYLRTGGMILFDTRDADISGFGGTTGNAAKLQRLAAPLDIPPLDRLPPDHVLTRSFYLLQDFPGRYVSRDIWVEAAPPDARQVEGMPFRDLNDGVTPVVIGGNDWAAAWAVDSYGGPIVPIGRGYTGQRQRELAYRFGVNLVMHVLTGNYKSDQVHVPALLDRLGQ